MFTQNLRGERRRQRQCSVETAFSTNTPEIYFCDSSDKAFIPRTEKLTGSQQKEIFREKKAKLVRLFKQAVYLPQSLVRNRALPVAVFVAEDIRMIPRPKLGPSFFLFILFYFILFMFNVYVQPHGYDRHAPSPSPKLKKLMPSRSTPFFFFFFPSARAW